MISEILSNKFSGFSTWGNIVREGIPVGFSVWGCGLDTVLCTYIHVYLCMYTYIYTLYIPMYTYMYKYTQIQIYIYRSGFDTVLYVFFLSFFLSWVWRAKENSMKKKFRISYNKTIPPGDLILIRRFLYFPFFFSWVYYGKSPIMKGPYCYCVGTYIILSQMYR